MNANLFRFAVSMSVLLLTCISCLAETLNEPQEYMQELRDHLAKRSFLTVRDEFRERLKQDADGTLIHKLLADDKLRGILFANFDSAPDIFIDLIMAEYFEDDSQWGDQAVFYYSPAAGLASELAERLQPKDSAGPTPPASLDFVMEDKKTRFEIARILRKLHSTEELSPAQVQERRSAAWDKIVALVNGSFERLLEEDTRKRQKFRDISGATGAADSQLKPVQGQSSERPVKRNTFSPPPQKELTSNQAGIWYGIASLVAIAGGVLIWRYYRSIP